MSTEQQFVLNHEPLDGGEEWDEKTFTAKGNFWSTVELIEGKGLEYEYETPDGYEVPGEKENTVESDEQAETLDAEVIDHTEDKPTDEEILDETIEPKADGSGTTTEAKIVEEDSEVPDQPPERDITDDPIEWLNRTAGDFVDTIQGTEAINKKGFRVLQHWYDIDTNSEVIVGPEETDFEYCRVRATAEMPDGQTAVAHGSAHVERGDDMPILLEMADTRAKSRALSDITGVGAVAVAELKAGENE